MHAGQCFLGSMNFAEEFEADDNFSPALPKVLTRSEGELLMSHGFVRFEGDTLSLKASEKGKAAG